MTRPMPAETHVVIAGGGIAGMAAATILAEAGVRVTLCEAAPEAGGKAKSVRLADGHPTEHSFRVYTDSYQTLLTLFSRIPTENGMTVLDNLVGVSLVSATEQGLIGQVAAPVPLERQRSTVARIVDRAVESLRPLSRIASRSPLLIVGLLQRGLKLSDIIPYLYAHLRLMWMCKERRLVELGDISYADYLKLSSKSPQAQAFFAALPRIYVGARPNAEAGAIAPMVFKGLFRLKGNCPLALNDVKLPSVMMMDGPTSERMVDPWIGHLRNLGVDIHFDTRVSDLEFENGRVAALRSLDGRRFACDYAILAVPYLSLRKMAEAAHAKRHLPHVAQWHAIALESSNSIQCFLSDLPAAWPSFIRPGVTAAYVESEWSLGSVLQGEGFWTNVTLPEGTRYVLSITWSEVDQPGRVFHRPLSECTPEEILIECLTQCGLDHSHILGWQISQELKHFDEADYEVLAKELPPHFASPPARGRRMVTFAPVPILLPGARHRSPGIGTEVPNLFLAGEAIYSPDLTEFLPIMEKAACSGYLAAHQIVNAVAPHVAPRLRIDFRDTAPFAVFRRMDRWLWRRRTLNPQQRQCTPEPRDDRESRHMAGVSREFR